MDIFITDFISGIDFGEVQSFKNLQIIPLFREGEEGKEEIRAYYSDKLYRLRGRIRSVRLWSIAKESSIWLFLRLARKRE